MENKMKKLVRQLSTRTRTRPAVATSPNTGMSKAAADPAQKNPLTSPIPPNTVIHFPKCPHSTPPTPRPAYIPPVLRTEITERSSLAAAPVAPVATESATNMQDPEIKGVNSSSCPPSTSAPESNEAIVPAGMSGPDPEQHDLEHDHGRERDYRLTSPTNAPGPATDTEEKDTTVHIKQYFSHPSRCLDCSLSLARQREASSRDLSAGILREWQLRLVELTSAAKAVCQVARIKNAEPGRSDGHLLREDVVVLEKIEAEEAVLVVKMAEEKERVEREVRDIWADVAREWEGGIREVVRGDGTGEAEERCVFVVSSPATGCDGDGDDQGEGEGGGGDGLGDGDGQGESAPAEGQDGVQVPWVPVEG
ncbi:hypothetical protein A1O7_03800 [Cladophialophora yegresii CBS 114405]|uniref:Uncharacterized protein n=1 Tax=Cladophialophora yegresii CBS 114405 TaxID=1182544 RepID=W9WMH9_9EURO|nr:uncharacterized protein A1O7_03800 [Cladophialophora yegresii CBS 114405]EXJ59654.1 hypothetical protein A1O7_03800 [Cladophialophora yegresii CBS 114405]